MVRFFTLIFIGMVAGCSFSPTEDGTGTQDPCYFRGEIAEGSVADFIERIPSQGCKDVTITSGGGEADAAFDFVDFLNQNDIGLIARDHCHSACSQIIGLLVNRFTVEPKTLIMLHGSPQDAKVWLDRQPDFPTSDRLIIARIAAELTERVRARGGDLTLMYEPLLRSQPVCIDLKPIGPGKLLYGTLYTGWMPTREWYEQLRGAPIEGEWIANLKQFKEVLREKGPAFDLVDVNFGGPVIGEDLIIENYDPVAMIQRIPVCTPELSAELMAQFRGKRPPLRKVDPD